jgi:hypothetical protein
MNLVEQENLRLISIFRTYQNCLKNFVKKRRERMVEFFGVIPYLTMGKTFEGAELAVIVGYPVTMVLPTVFEAITL